MKLQQAQPFHAVDQGNRMGLKAPGLLTFLISLIVMLAVLAARYFNATIPGLEGNITQFAGLLVAYFILMFGCLFRAL